MAKKKKDEETGEVESVELNRQEMDAVFRSLKDTLASTQAVGKKAVVLGLKETAHAALKDAKEIEELMQKFLTKPEE